MSLKLFLIYNSGIQEEMSFKSFLIFNSGFHLVWQSRTILSDRNLLGNFDRGHLGEQFCVIILTLKQ